MQRGIGGRGGATPKGQVLSEESGLLVCSGGQERGASP